MDWEGGGVFAREFVATINGRQETLDLDVHYRGSSLGEPTNCKLTAKTVVCAAYVNRIQDFWPKTSIGTCFAHNLYDVTCYVHLPKLPID